MRILTLVLFTIWGLAKSFCTDAHVLSPQITGHTSVYINEPRLSDFKQVLNKAGIQAEFAGGVLICNNVVAVRRVRNVFENSNSSQFSESTLLSFETP